MTLKNKLSLIVSVLFVSLLILVAAVLVRLAEQEIKKGVSVQQHALAVAVASDTDQRLTSIHAVLISAARALPPAALSDPQQVQNYLQANSALYPTFNSVFVYSPDGIVLAAYPTTLKALGSNFGEFEYIRQTRATVRPQISKPFIGPVSGEPLIVMTAPVVDAQGKLLAIFGGSQYFLQQSIFATLTDTKIGRTGYFSLITRDRVIVAHPDRSRILQTVAPGANLGLEAALTESTYTGETVSSKGIPILTSYQTLRSTGWILVAALPIAEAYEPIRLLRADALGATAMLGVLLPWVIWLVMRYLTRPIIALRDRIRELVAAPQTDLHVDASSRDEIGEVARAFNELTDARKRAQLALREQEAVLHGFFDSANVQMSIVELLEDDFIYLLPNRGIAEFYGLSAEQMTGKRASELGIPASAITSALEKFRRCLATGQRIETEFGFTHNGQTYCLYAYFSPLSNSPEERWVGWIATDVTERMLAQQRLQRIGKLYEALSETSQAIVHERDRAGLLQRICDIAVHHAEFRLAWIGMINTETATIEAVARAGMEGALPYVDKLNISLDPEVPEGNVPAALAVRTETEYVCNNFATDPAMLPNRERARQYRLGCGAAFPLREAGKVVGALVVYAEEVDVFHDDILTLLREMAEEISFAFDNFVKDAARRQAETHLRHLFAVSPAAIILQYPVPDTPRFQLRTISISPAIERITGYTAAEWLTGEPTEQLRERVHPDDAAGTIARQKMLRQNGELLAEYRLRHKDGSYRLIQDNATAVRDGSGRIVEVIRVWFDITEYRRAEAALHESEEQFRDLVDTTRDVIYALTADGVITTLNPAFETVTGWPRGEWIGKLYTQLLHPEDVEFAAKMREGILRGSLPIPFRLRVRTRTGDYAVLEIQASARRREGQEIVVLGIGRDLTERLSLEAQLRQSQKMEAIGQLAGGIAHDFNNILTAIVGNSRLARGDLAPTHPAQESLVEIEKAAQRAIDLVRQILTFGQRREQQRKPLKVQDIVEEALKLMRTTLPATIEIQTRFAPDTPAVLADATEIHQLMMNLVSNAADAMRGRDGKLEVILEPINVDAELARTLSDLTPGRYAHLAITDTGVGMGSDTMERIFEPFFTTKGLGQGTGLGLSVVHGIVKSHEGAMGVQSQPGRGATFHIYFPAIDAVVEDETAAAPAVLYGKGEHILFVDDEEALVFLAKRTLERMGYRVSAFIHPLEALAAFARDPHGFDAVVTDISMPKMPGPELAARLLQLRRDIPIIMTSGYIRPEDTEAAQRIGVREIVFKPNTIIEFAEILRHALAGESQNAAPTPPG